MKCSKCGYEHEAKFCPECGAAADGTPVQPQIVINNVNSNTNTNVMSMGMARAKDKWIALLLCIFLGGFGAHKFYEGKIGMGILYLFTAGLFGIGWIIDIIVLLLKPNPYYV